MKYKIEIEIDVDPKAVEIQNWNEEMLKNKQSQSKVIYKPYKDLEERYLKWIDTLHLKGQIAEDPTFTVTNSKITKL